MNGNLWKALGVLFGALASVIVSITFKSTIDNGRQIASVSATLIQIEKHLNDGDDLMKEISAIWRELAAHPKQFPPDWYIEQEKSRHAVLDQRLDRLEEKIK